VRISDNLTVMKQIKSVHATCFVVFVGVLCLSAVRADESKVSSMSGEWAGYIEPLIPIGGRLLQQINNPEDPLLRHELYRATLSAMAGGYLALLHADAKHPEFIPFVGQLINLLGPNPDAMYSLALIEDDGIYRISGYRGTVREVVIQLAGGTFVPTGNGNNMGTTYANHDLDDLHLKGDGSFQVLLSRERPADYVGDWWQLPADSTYLMVRQIAYDWGTEIDGRMAIERLDTPAIKPRPSTDQIAEKIQQLAVFAEAYVAMSNRVVQGFARQAPLNSISFINFADDGGMPNQYYLEGIFDLQPDEALILETKVPESCAYWSFQLTDERWTSYDWTHRQINLNGHTAEIDSDGKFRAVISARDPKVPNWLDTGGLQRGVIQGRWKKCTSGPLPKITKVAISAIRDHLPNVTRLVSFEEREESIRERTRQAQMRRKW
jgi:Protein of unknown function (DUF1214)